MKYLGHSSLFPWVACLLLFAVPRLGAAQGLTPEEALRRMSLPGEMEATLVASEPLVRQPVAIEFDDRGRLWVIQYLQYPNPAELNRVQVDRYSRTKYDRVPDPPPRGPRGADRITILEDTNGDGRMDRGKDFVDGLNLASGLAFGHDGVFVLNVPYLLFYPDRDRNDVPDTDPEVLLSGFGMEDAHSVANSLTWGPDGWLYGCQGSTVTANVRGIEFQQGVWRYHPRTREFELFCEGGGNSWGLDFDRAGRLFYSTNFGGHTLLHGVQGGYFVKSFGKHGALHNPHAYGYFEHAPHANFQGGHVTVGGIIYQGDAFPDSFRGAYVAGDLLGHGVYWHTIQPRGSTVSTAHGGKLLVANDPWFAPTDVTLGPDGAVYVADWHDARTAHPDPDAEWDRTNGRIYRLAPKGTPLPPSVDFARMTYQELLQLHSHPNQWHVRRARQELTRRLSSTTSRNSPPTAATQDESERLRARFRETALSSDSETASLEALWSLHALESFDESLARQLLERPHSFVRAWTIRLLGDRRVLSDDMAHRLDELAEQEPSVDVRQQLACSAARFAPRQALPIINAHINRDLDRDDPYLPLLWWWAIERHSVAGREEVLKRFVRPTLWKSQLGRQFLLTRLIRRYAAERSTDGIASVVRLLKAAPSDADRRLLWPHVLVGWNEQPRESRSPEWIEEVQASELAALVLADWRTDARDRVLHQLGIELRLRAPIEAARREAFDEQRPAERRALLLDMLQWLEDPSLLEPSLRAFQSSPSDAIRDASLRVLSRFDDQRIHGDLLTWFRQAPASELRDSVLDLLLSRPTSARAWLESVDRGEIAASTASLDRVRRIAHFSDPRLDALVTKHWGRLEAATAEEKLAEVRRLHNDLRAGDGDRGRGRELFKKHCGSCHQLFGEGTRIGPDLTSANRQDRDFLLVSLVDPSSVIRKEYVSVVIETTSGRLVTGLPVERADGHISLVDAKGERRIVSTQDIATLRDSPQSLMPADLYRQLRPQDLRDLFAYLQSAR